MTDLKRDEEAIHRERRTRFRSLISRSAYPEQESPRPRRDLPGVHDREGSILKSPAFALDRRGGDQIAGRAREMGPARVQT